MPYKPKNSKFWHYDFVWKGDRFYGSTGCTSERLARQYEAQIRHEALFPSKKRPPITVDDACGLYQDHVELMPSWSTTEYMLAALVEGLGGKVLLADVSQRHLMRYIAKRRQGRTNSSVNRELDMIRAIWNRAKRARFDVGEMPDWGALRLKVERTAPRILDRKRDDDRIDAVREDVRDAVRFLLLSGWRRNEVINLCWADINQSTRMARTRIKGGDIVDRPITTALATIIKRQPMVGPRIFTYVCQRTGGGRAERTRRVNGQRYPLTITVLRDAWDAGRGDADFAQLRLHDLRHTRATRILQATGNLAATKEALQHRSIKTTLRYAHVMNDDVRRALDQSETHDFQDKSRNSPEARPKKSAK